MRPQLLKSFIVVIAFWFVATAVYWSFQQPDEKLQTAARVKELLPFVPFDTTPSDGWLANLLGGLAADKNVLLYWTLPLLAVVALACALGAGGMWLVAHRKSDERKARETGSGAYRGVTVSLGVLPTPHSLPRDDLDLSAEDNELLARMTDKELRLLTDVLGTLSAHPDAYPGEGVTVSLLEHGLNMAGKALHSKRNPGLCAIAAAAHELGKITSFKKEKDGSWSQVKNHDRESARILGTLDAWAALPSPDKHAVMMAVKFKNNPRNIPDVNGDAAISRFARDLLYSADDAKDEALTEQKQKVLEEAAASLPDLIYETFIKALPSLSFQNRGLPKGVAAVAWKFGNRVYLLEIKLRETVMAKLPAEVRAALTPNPKERPRVQPFSAELLKALDARGWLVKKANETRLEAKDALWNIRAGKLDFKGVIIIDVPEQYVPQLPASDSMYEVAVTGPLFASAASAAAMGMSKNDLLGSVLKPSTTDKAV